MAASPNVLNYYSGYGNMYYTPVGGIERHMGNCPKFTTKLTPDELDHTSAMDGQGLVDDSINKATTGEISLTLDEYTLENLQIASLGGDIAANTAGDDSFEAGAATSILGALRFTGTNIKGNQFEVVVHSVKINPSEVDWLSPGAYGQLDLTGKILAVAGSFFTVTEIPVSA